MLAQNAAASCTIRYGDTIVLATVCDEDPREGLDFFPLTIDFEERMYAIGKIPGSFFRREGRPGNDATLAARMTDRPIRPLFPKGFIREVHVVFTLLSSDRNVPADVFGATGASTVLGMSHIPFEGPVSSVRVGRVDGQLKAFPTYEELESSDLDLIVAGTEDSIVMIEAGASEVPESDIREAIEYAQGVIATLNELQREIADALGEPKMEFTPSQTDAELEQRVRAALEGDERRMLDAVADEGWRGVNALARAVAAELDDDELDDRVLRGGGRGRGEGLRAPAHPGAEPARGRPPRGRGARAEFARRHPAAGARLRAVPARRHTGAERGHAGRHRRPPAAGQHPTRRSSSAICTTTTSRPTRSARRASCAAPAGARSVTGCSPSGH